MKQFKTNSLLCCAAMAFLLLSCSNNADTETTGEDTGLTATTANTIVITPENMLVVIHPVADFAKWKVAYEAHDSARLANGIHKYVLGRGLYDTGMVLAAMKAGDMAQAKSFVNSEDLKKIMQDAGVTGQPKIHFVTATWQDTANLGDVPRSMTTFNVKDWDAWYKNFQEGKQERIDNGISERVVGHVADDNKKVMLVTALTDTTKAFSYYQSDALKKRREAGGLTSEPERFLFRVVQRY